MWRLMMWQLKAIIIESRQGIMGNVVCERVTKVWVGAPPSGKCSSIFTHCVCVAASHLHMSVWWTVGRRWKMWLLTARLCSSLNGSRTTPSRTGNVSRSSSLRLPGKQDADDKLVHITGHITKITRYLYWKTRKNVTFIQCGHGWTRLIPEGGGSAFMLGLISGGNWGFMSWFGDGNCGMLLPGVTGGVGFPGNGEWG